MTPDEQLDAWVEGRNLHNVERDECCPDFSCCQDQFQATPEERRLFRDRPELRDEMLMHFLINLMIVTQNRTVYAAGGDVHGDQ